MTTQKYVITFVIFALLLVLALSLFVGGLFMKEQSAVAFYILITFSCLCSVSAIIIKEAGIFMDTYKFGVAEGIRILNDAS